MMSVFSSDASRNRSWFIARHLYPTFLLGVALLFGSCRKAETTIPDARSSSLNVCTEEHRNAQGHLVSTETFYTDEYGKKVLHGPQIVWFDNGRKSQEVYCVDGKRHGSHIEWDQFGLKVLEGTWAHDRKDGLWTGWYGPGRKSWECTYQGGLIVGTRKLWSTVGKLQSEERYEKGRVREVTDWFDNGQKRRHGTFSVSEENNSRGLFEGPPRDGVWTHWNREGKEIARGTWKDGKPWDGICGVPKQSLIDPEAGIERFGQYKDGKLMADVPVTRTGALAR